MAEERKEANVAELKPDELEVGQGGVSPYVKYAGTRCPKCKSDRVKMTGDMGTCQECGHDFDLKNPK